MIKSYYKLIKPGVMYGNSITTIAGALFAFDGDISLPLITATTLGTSLTISSACVINNYLDQDIDRKMERTQSRPLITGEVSGKQALTFGTLLGLIGLIILTAWTNYLVVLIGVVGFVTYVWLYGALGKRLSVHGTLVGSISGAIPILAGYVAVTGSIDWTAIILFLILFFWQMPEFYSISIFRRSEYAAADVPVSSVVRGITRTKQQILIYTLLTIACLIWLSFTSLASLTYGVVILAMSARLLQVATEGLFTNNNIAWSRSMFRSTLVILLVFCLMISINPYLQ